MPIANVRCIMKTETHMSSTNTDRTTADENPGETEAPNPVLIQWEEWSLSAEEYYHALSLHRANPKGKPMGHK